MLRAYDELTSPTGEVTSITHSDGVLNTVKTGQCVECVVDQLYYRQPVPYADASQRFLIEQGLDVENGKFCACSRFYASFPFHTCFPFAFQCGPECERGHEDHIALR